MHDAEATDCKKPDDANRTEELRHHCRSTRLNRKQSEHQNEGDIDDCLLRDILADAGNCLGSFNCRKHRQRRSEDRVAVEQRCANRTQYEHNAFSSADTASRQREKRKHATLAIIVSTHQKNDVLDRYHEN